jgi:hypothetical protein
MCRTTAAAGDGLYAPKTAWRSPRLALHACVLGFVHPVTGEAMRFEAPLADDLEMLRRSLSPDLPLAVQGGPR